MTGTPACAVADPELFFPTTYGDAHGPLVDAAKALCGHCSMRRECLDRALAAQETFGIWGGTTPAERLRVPHGGRAL